MLYHQRLRWIVVLILLGICVSFFGLMAQTPQHDPQESALQEKCAKCHGEDVETQEWKRSAHAHALTNLRKLEDAEDSCVVCHSSRVESPQDAWGRRNPVRVTLENAVNEVSCSSCHLHRSKRRHYLIKSSLALCSTCHQMDCGCAGKGIIHQSQVEMYLGKRGFGVMTRPSPHREVIEKDCVGCHMYKPEPKEDVALTGGHTFKADYRVCMQCHGNVMPRVEKLKKEIGLLLEQVNARLESMDPKSPNYKFVQQNRDMVVKDGGYGIHNFAYAKALLQYALTVESTMPGETE